MYIQVGSERYVPTEPWTERLPLKCMPCPAGCLHQHISISNKKSIIKEKLIFSTYLYLWGAMPWPMMHMDMFTPAQNQNIWPSQYLLSIFCHQDHVLIFAKRQMLFFFLSQQQTTDPEAFRNIKLFVGQKFC